jgi:hypothetical protein
MPPARYTTTAQSRSPTTSGDLDLVDPSLTDARYWRDQPGQDTAGERTAIVLVGAKTA